MPLVRNTPPSQDVHPTVPGFDDATAGLHHHDPERRRAAVRILAEHGTKAVAPLAGSLAAESEPAIRTSILTALIHIGGEEAARALAPYLRAEDAGLRNGAVEALQAMPESTQDLLPELLGDADADVRLLAAELARTQPADRATELLGRCLEQETHSNTCAAMIEVLAEVGTRDALPILRRVGQRFAGDPFLPFAVSVAIGRIEGGER